MTHHSHTTTGVQHQKQYKRNK